jgi:CheY-like chemotaxis protein/HPt (histidine-containing phosphotransfer) domain-containing protein
VPDIPPLLDDQALAALHEDFASTGDLDELAALIRGFLDRGVEQVAEIGAAARDGNLPSVRASAHKLQGASRTLGASLTGTVCAKLEDAAAAGDGDTVRRTVPELEVVFSLTRATLGDAVDAIGGDGAVDPAGAGAGTGGPLRALLVDHEPIALAVLRATVERLGHDATVVTDGEAALTELDRVRPHLVVTDMHMPGIDGIELARRIRSRRSSHGSDPYIAVLSASGRDADASIGSTIDAGLSKPVREDELRAVLELAAARAGVS